MKNVNPVTRKPQKLLSCWYTHISKKKREKNETSSEITSISDMQKHRMPAFEFWWLWLVLAKSNRYKSNLARNGSGYKITRTVNNLTVQSNYLNRFYLPVKPNVSAPLCWWRPFILHDDCVTHRYSGYTGWKILHFWYLVKRGYCSGR